MDYIETESKYFEAFSVNYFLDAAELERLKAILEAAKRTLNARHKDGDSLTLAGVFNGIMITGSKWLIDDRLTLAEVNAGIITPEEAERRRRQKAELTADDFKQIGAADQEGNEP